MTLTNYQKTRVVFDLEGMPEEDFTQPVILCLPRFAWLAARTFLRGYGLRAVNYATSYTEAGYNQPDPAVFDQIDASISEFLGGTDMTNEILTGLAAIALSIDNLAGVNAACCSGGSFGAGSTAPPNAGFVDDGSTTFPPGFTDRPEYIAAKCAAANYIIASIRADMEFIKTVDIIALTTTALVASLLTPVPFDDILALLGFVVALAAQGFLISIAQEVIDFIDANAEELVCTLFKANDSITAETLLQGTFDASTSTSASLMADFYINSEAMNSLFELSTTVQGGSLTMGVDCDNCQGDPCGAGVITGQYNNQGFDAAGRITILVNSDQFNVTGCGLRYREYMQITPPSLVQVISSELDGNCPDPHIWRSTPVNNSTGNWTIDGLPPVDNAAHLIGTISLHTLCPCSITLLCAE